MPAVRDFSRRGFRNGIREGGERVEIVHNLSQDKKSECASVITKAPPFGGAYLNSDCAADLFHKILHAGSMGS